MNRRGFVGRSLGVLAATAGPMAAGAGAAGQPGAAASGDPSAAFATEEVLEPGLPIVDPHHHLWDHTGNSSGPRTRYLLEDFLADVNAGGHNVTETVFVDCRSMYRTTGPEELRSLGETEFVNGIAAMSASGAYGPCRVASGIVAFVDLRLGERARPVLEAHRAAAGSRFKGVRNSGAWDAFPVMGMPLDPARNRLLADPGLRQGVAVLASMDLVFESWLFHTQIPQLADLAAAVPQATMVLNHVGTPIGVGPYAEHPQQTFADWKRHILEIARRPNVVCKLGGLGMQFASPALAARKGQAGSEELARAWKPYFETCIEAFGAQRCMFESNFPPDGASCSYRALWNGFKRCVAGASAAEKTALFSGTAKRVYRLGAA
ncbi:MAG: amidohydrolase family protein [Steroidobacteraceae bacterium]